MFNIMATKVKKGSVLGEVLNSRRKQIVGIELKDGSLLLGDLIEVFDDPDYGIWFRFEGVSPLVPKQNATLTEFLTKGTKNPEAMVISGLFPLSNVKHFIFGITTGKLLQEQLKPQDSNKETNNDTEEVDNEVIDFSKDTKMEMKVTQEKITDDKKVN